MNDIFNENVPLKTETPAFAKHVLPAVPSSEVYLEDCVTALKRFSDNHFDLAIVDPPYMDVFNTDNWVGTCAKQKSYKNRQDTLTDKKPNDEYFVELRRVSKNQIIWVLYKNGWTFKEVGQALGGRDHSTAINSNSEMNDWIYLDKLNRATDEQRDAVQMAMIANRFYLSNVSPSPSTQMDKIKRASEMAASGSSLYSVLGACC